MGDSHRGGAGRPCGRREKTGAATSPPAVEEAIYLSVFQLVRTRRGPRTEPIVRVCRSTRQTFGFSRQTRAFMTQSRRSKRVPSLSFVAELDNQTSPGLPRQRVHNKASQDNDYTTNYRLTSEIEPIDPPREDTREPECNESPVFIVEAADLKDVRDECRLRRMDRRSLLRSIFARTSLRTDANELRTPLMLSSSQDTFSKTSGGCRICSGTTHPGASSLIREMTSIWRRRTTESSTTSSVGNVAPLCLSSIILPRAPYFVSVTR